MERQPSEMAKRGEYEYEYKPKSSGIYARCNLKLYDNDRGSIVILTELPDNPGQSVTNAAEEIATKAVGDFNLNPQATVWVEHYPERRTIKHGRELVADKEEWAEVTFKWTHLSNDEWVASDPQWNHVTRSDVEDLVGEI